MPNYYTTLFVKVTGYYNLVFGLLAIAMFKLLFKLCYAIDYDASLHSALLLHHILLFGFIAIIGCGLIKASDNLAKHNLLLLVSGLGKTFACATWIVSYFKDGLPITLVLAGISDLLIAIVYLKIYFSLNKA